MAKYILLAVTILLGATGQFLLKTGVNRSASRINGLYPLKELANTVFVFMTNPWILSALAIYAGGMIIYLFLLTKFDLNYVFPVFSTIYVLIMIISWLFLKEPLPFLRIVGTLVITAGVFLVMLTNK